jgi:ferredoxin/coenzyme F420-reducing hydrogenase delta subunit
MAALAGMLAAWRRLEQVFDRAFGSRANPLRQLGTLACLALWLLVVSGVWLYVVFDTSAAGAHASIEALSRHPWSPGGLVRSLHRYAADAFVVFTALHVLSEIVHGRWRHVRRFAWWTGTVLLPMLAVSAVGGFWLNWDRLGQFSAVATAEWLDALPLLASPLARNFIGAGAVGDRLFSLFVFVHLGVPLLLVFGLWFHLQRLTRAAVFPPRALALGTTGTLLALAVVAPVSGQGPADLAQVTPVLALDWFILFMHPLAYASSASLAWTLLLGSWLALLALPLLPARVPRAPVAVVEPAQCNGCRRCFADCPFAAITMAPHPNGRAGRQVARVDADLCAGCGICAGACPSSTPFRSMRELVSGIDMPQLPIGALRDRLSAELARLSGAARVIVFGCDHGADVRGLQAADTAAISLLCAGQLPPAFVEYALRRGADAVLVVACPEDGCAFRHGGRWTEERLLGQREPYLRERIPAQSWRLIKAGHSDAGRLQGELVKMRSGLRDAARDGGAVHA